MAHARCYEENGGNIKSIKRTVGNPWQVVARVKDPRRAQIIAKDFQSSGHRVRMGRRRQTLSGGVERETHVVMADIPEKLTRYDEPREWFRKVHEIPELKAMHRKFRRQYGAAEGLSKFYEWAATQYKANPKRYTYNRVRRTSGRMYYSPEEGTPLVPLLEKVGDISPEVERGVLSVVNQLYGTKFLHSNNIPEYIKRSVRVNVDPLSGDAQVIHTNRRIAIIYSNGGIQKLAQFSIIADRLRSKQYTQPPGLVPREPVGYSNWTCGFCGEVVSGGDITHARKHKEQENPTVVGFTRTEDEARMLIGELKQRHPEREYEPVFSPRHRTLTRGSAYGKIYSSRRRIMDPRVRPRAPMYTEGYQVMEYDPEEARVFGVKTKERDIITPIKLPPRLGNVQLSNPTRYFTNELEAQRVAEELRLKGWIVRVGFDNFHSKWALEWRIPREV